MSSTSKETHDMLLPKNRVHVLPEGVANRIAAGEVVERPASVAKELIENALDAGATKIVVSVKNAGFDELIVSDNGWGMDEEDVVTAFRRHATSKIKSAEDLHCILNLGFRGEALPSIGSVARVEVSTRREDLESGVIFRVDGGKETPVEPFGRERGTTVRVRSLFFNVPARRKFLRTPATEYGHIARMFKQYALSYPELHWELHRDGREVWSLRPSDLRGRIGQLLGEDLLEGLHDLEYKSDDVQVTGVVGGASHFKRSRGDQFLFVNRRPFQNHSLNHAVVNGFGPMIFPGQYPFYVVQLHLDPEEFDVNVHPAKHEIRFSNDGAIYRSVLVAVRNALGLSIRSGESPVQAPLASSKSEERVKRSVDGLQELELTYGKPTSSWNSSPSVGGGASGPVSAMNVGCGSSGSFRAQEQRSVPIPPIEGDALWKRGKVDVYTPTVDPTEQSRSVQTSNENAPEKVQYASQSMEHGEEATHEPRKVWQLHKMYILSQTQSGVVIVDQHVAHERILFEKAIFAMQEKPWNGQQLLFPVQVKVDPADAMLLEEMQPALERMGFTVEPFGGDDWVVRSVPAGVKIKNEARLLREMLTDYRDEYKVRMKPEESLAATFACRAAIKAGDPLNVIEMNALLDELGKTQYPFVCPHGRPVAVNLTIHELNRMFGRE